MQKFQFVLKELAKDLPGFNVKIKEDSFLMNLISKLLFFNKSFSENFITTIGKTVYFPKKILQEGNEDSNIATLCHEYVHAKDANKIGLNLFSFFYLFPQSLAPFMLFLSFYSFYLSIVLFIICLLPWPAYWRKQYELKAYKMSLFVRHKLFVLDRGVHSVDENVQDTIIFFNSQFISSAYYWMWLPGVLKQLNDAQTKIKQDSIFEESELYLKVDKILKAAIDK